jgi:hypothetical protein
MRIEERNAAFTVVELLLLSRSSSPGGTVAAGIEWRKKAKGIYCMNSLRQLQLAIVMYTGENQE